MIEGYFFVAAWSATVGVFFIAFFLFWEALPLFRHVPVKEFLLGRSWYPTENPAEFGALPILLGSLWVTLGALIIAGPLGIATAIFIAEVLPPKFRDIFKSIIELLAGIPSVIYGFFGLLIIVPWVRETFHLPTGQTALVGSFILGVMALPTIVSIAEDALYSVPKSFREASLALGANKWQTISRVTVPSAFSGISAAIILGLGRAIGETMAVMMVTGNSPVIPHSFFQPVRTMTATIALEMGEAVRGSHHYRALFAIGALLFLITLLLNLTADWIIHRQRIKRGG